MEKKLKLEMKEERNITLTLDKAKEWYNKGEELREIALQAFTKQELNVLPESWDEYCKDNKIPAMIFGPCIPHKYDALWRLEQLRDCYRQGWKPQCGEPVYAIKLGLYGLSIYEDIRHEFLSFQSEKIAKEFLKNFKHLIQIAVTFI